MNENGFVTLYRKFIKWEWYQKSEMVQLFLYFLLMANYEPSKWQGQTIERGQLVTGRLRIAADTGLSQRTIRTCMKRLKTTHEVTIKTTNRYSIVTITKYNEYQDKEKKRHTERHTERPTNDQQTTTSNNITIKQKNTYMDCVLLTEPEYQKLITKFGKPNTNQRIEELNNYILSKGIKYKSHYATILVWYAKELKNQFKNKLVVTGHAI